MGDAEHYLEDWLVSKRGAYTYICGCGKKFGPASQRVAWNELGAHCEEKREEA